MPGPADPYGTNDLGGVYYAIVTKNDDKEGPGARVRVRYPWLPEGDRDQSFWAPIAASMIGAGFGTYTLPDVDDTVLVMFLAGDINHPVVIGGTWNTADTPPETNEDGRNDFRLIKSRARHRLIFDDSASTKVVLTDKGDRHMLDVGQHGRQGSSPNALAVPAGGASQGVAAVALSGSVRLSCPGRVVFRAIHVDIGGGGGASLVTENMTMAASEVSLGATGNATFQGAPLKLGGG